MIFACSLYHLIVLVANFLSFLHKHGTGGDHASPESAGLESTDIHSRFEVAFEKNFNGFHYHFFLCTTNLASFQRRLYTGVLFSHPAVHGWQKRGPKRATASRFPNAGPDVDAEEAACTWRCHRNAPLALWWHLGTNVEAMLRLCCGYAKAMLTEVDGLLKVRFKASLEPRTWCCHRNTKLAFWWQMLTEVESLFKAKFKANLNPEPGGPTSL